jgi:DNA-binding CsgD family transcriptional regulator
MTDTARPSVDDGLSGPPISAAQTFSRHDGGAIRRRLSAWSRIARTEMVLLNPGPTVEDEARDWDLLARGVTIRSVYPDSARQAEYRGGQFRTVSSLPTQLVVLDRKVAFLPLDATDLRFGAWEVRAGGVISAAYALFEQFWRLGRDPAVIPGNQPEPTPLSRALLRLMGDGLTDEAVARRLGLSRRTVTRLIAELAGTTGANSRFQLGAAAAVRGWLPTAITARPGHPC